MFTKHGSIKRAGWLALSFILSTGMILTTLPAAYAVPMMTNYQGTLKDKLGRPLNSVVTLTFAVYDVPASGTALWTETHPSVSIKDGAFSVVLGSKVKIPETVAQGERYLGMKVNTNAEMTPRQALVSGFFAMRAGVAESVASGSVTNDKLGAASVTSEKVADGAVSNAKLAANAVTGDKLAANVVTTDKIANGAVTNEKLSADVQQKLAQTGQTGVPATVATLNVTEKLKVGKNSLYLGPLTPGGTDNSIYTAGSDLLVQSDPTNVFNTVINANNTGKVGIGTGTPTSKLSLSGGDFLISPFSDVPPPPGPGLQLFYESKIPFVGAEIVSFSKGTPAPLEFSQLTITAAPIIMISQTGKSALPIAPIRLTGSPIILNGDYLTEKKVSIGTTENLNMLDVNGGVTIGSFKIPNHPLDCLGPTPSVDCRPTAPQDGLFVKGSVAVGTKITKNKLDVAGSIAIGSGYAGTQTAPANGLLVEGNVGIGTTDPSWAKLEIQAVSSALRVSTDNGDWSYNSMFHVLGDNVKAIAVLRGKAHEVSYDKFVVMGNGDVFGRSFIPQSDVSLKEDIEPLKNSLERVLKLRGVSFRFKDNPEKDKPKEIGVIAQEVEKVVPEVVKTTHEGIKHVNYQNLVALLIESTKEQQLRFEQLKAQNDALKTIVCKDHPEETICQ